MNRINKLLVAAFMSAAMLFPNMVQAMEIRQFDKMAERDRNKYVAELVQGAEKVLTDAGQADRAAKVSKLFTTHIGNDQTSVGIVEFMSNLARTRLADVQNVAKNPNAQRMEVEDAMAFTLHKNGIEVPDSFYTVLGSFKLKFPPATALPTQ